MEQGAVSAAKKAEILGRINSWTDENKIARFAESLAHNNNALSNKLASNDHYSNNTYSDQGSAAIIFVSKRILKRAIKPATLNKSEKRNTQVTTKYKD